MVLSKVKKMSFSYVKNTASCRLILPKTWCDLIGVDPENPNVRLVLSDNKITVEPWGQTNGKKEESKQKPARVQKAKK